MNKENMGYIVMLEAECTEGGKGHMVQWSRPNGSSVDVGCASPLPPDQLHVEWKKEDTLKMARSLPGWWKDVTIIPDNWILGSEVPAWGRNSGGVIIQQ